MRLDGRTADLCIEGIRAEFERRLDDARALFREAWLAAVDDYDRAVAAHYVAHLEAEPGEALRWNLVALECAQRDDRTHEFAGSLLVSLGGAYETLGDTAEAERYFAMAAECGVDHVRDR